jgi:putative nucleotidyltransferase with HDIG domain
MESAAPGPDLDLLALARDRAAAFDLPAWLVGGAVRDRLLGRATLDTDLLVPDQAVALARDIARVGGGSLVVLDAERDIARVVWPGPPQVVLDVTGFNGSDLTEDLAARDFTVNALAIPLADADAFDSDQVVDPTGGLSDLNHGIVRMTSPAAFAEDPLRLLRGVRLARELGFTIDSRTHATIRASAVQVSEPAGERVREELLRLLSGPAPAGSVGLLDELALLAVILPELTACRGVTQSPPHDRDVYDHCCAVLAAMTEQVVVPGPTLDQSRLPDPWPATLAEYGERVLAGLHESLGSRPRWLYLRLAALLHDIGKPATRSVVEPGGRVRFLGHEQVGAELCRGIVQRLRIGGREGDYLVGLVRHHMRPLQLAGAGRPSRRAVYRYFRATGELGVDLPMLALADGLGKGALPASGLSELGNIAAELWRSWFDEAEVVVRPPPLLRGDELMLELGLEPGPLIGRLVEALRAGQAAGTIADRDQALTLARRLAGRGVRTGS